MLTKLLIIFCGIASSLAAPRCIDLCTPTVNTHGTHSSLIQQQNSLRELQQAVTDHLRSLKLNIDLNRPGNWTDHKDYRTSDGAGQVHEEAGQLVNGGAQVRYYKKNYAATYGSGSNNLELGHNLESDSLLHDDLLHSRSIGSVQNYGFDQTRLDSSRLQDSANTHLYNSHVVGANNDNWSRLNTYGVDGGRGEVYEEEGQFTHRPAKVRYYKKNYTSSYTSSGTGAPSVLPISDFHSQAQQLESHLNQLSRDLHSQNIHSQNTAGQSEYGRVYTQNNYPQHYQSPVTTQQRYEHTSEQEQTVKSGGNGYIPVQPVTHFNYVVPDTELENVGTSQVTGRQTQTVQTHRTQVEEERHNHQTDGLLRVPLRRDDYGSNVNTYRGDMRGQETLTEEQALRNQLRDNIQYEPARVLQTHPGRRVEEHWESNSRHRVESTIPHHETAPVDDSLTHQRITQGLGYSGQATQVSGESSSSYQRHEQHGSSGSYRVGSIDLGHQVADCDTLGEAQLGQYSRRHKRDVEFGQQRESPGGYQYSGYGQNSHEGHQHQDYDRQRNYGHGYGQQSHEGHPHQDDDRHRHHGQNFEQNSGSGYGYQSYEHPRQDGDRLRNYGQGYGQQSHDGHPHQDDDRHRHHGQNFEQNSGSGFGYQSYEHPRQDDDRHRHHGQNFEQNSGSGFGYQSHEGNYGQGYGQQSHEGHPHQDDDRYRHSGQDYSSRYRREEYHHENYDHKSHEGHPHQDDDRHRHASQDNDWDNHEGHGHDHQSHEGHPHQDDDRHAHSGSKHRYKRESQRYQDFDQHSGVDFGDLSQQTTGEFDFGQNTEKLEKQKIENFNQESQGVDFWHQQAGDLELGQQTEDLSQQTHKFDEFGQHHHELKTGNLEFGQQTEDLSQQSHKFDFGQQTEDLSQQTHKFDKFGQHQSGSHEFGQHHHGLETGNWEFGQQTEDLSQQNHKFDFGQQTEDLNQQTHKLDNFGQHQSSSHGFGQHHHGLESGNLEFGQETEDFTQQTHKFDEFSQHQSGSHEFGQHHHGSETGSLEFGQQTEDFSHQSHKFDFGQQTEDLSQQTHKFDEFGQHQSGRREFGQHHHGLETGNLEFGQQTEDLSQQSHQFDDFSHHQSEKHEFGQHHHGLETGNLEFGQQTEDFSHQSHKFDFGQQTEDLSQQTHKFDEFGQHQSGRREFGQHHHGLDTGNLEFGQQTEDLSQQSHKFEFGQQTEDLSQQTHKFDDFSQTQSGTHDFGQHHHKLEAGSLELGQQTEDFSQQTHKFDDFSQQQSGTHEFGQHHNQLQTGGLEFGQQTEDLSQQTHKFDDFSQHQSGSHEFDQQHNQLQSGGLEFGQTDSKLDQQNQQTGFNPSGNYPREFKPAPKPTPRPLRIGSQRGDVDPEIVGPVGPVSSLKPAPPVRPVKGGRAHPPRVLSAPYRNPLPSAGVLSLEEQALAEELANSWHQSHHPGDLTSENQNQQSQDDSAPLQSRILEVYGAKSPYEPGLQGDYSGVKPNPSATLQPQYHGNDPWEIREASEKISARNAAVLDSAPEITTPVPETTPAPGFWKKIGNKITNSYEKAKEKLSETFG